MTTKSTSSNFTLPYRTMSDRLVSPDGSTIVPPTEIWIGTTRIEFSINWDMRITVRAYSNGDKVYELTLSNGAEYFFWPDVAKKITNNPFSWEGELYRALRDYRVKPDKVVLMAEGQPLNLKPLQYALLKNGGGTVSSGQLTEARHCILFTPLGEPHPFRNKVLAVYVWPSYLYSDLRYDLKQVTFGDVPGAMVQAAKRWQSAVDWALFKHRTRPSLKFPDRIYVDGTIYFIDAHRPQEPREFDVLRRIHGYRFLSQFWSDPQQDYVRARHDERWARSMVRSYYCKIETLYGDNIVPRVKINNEPSVNPLRAYRIITSKFPRVAL